MARLTKTIEEFVRNEVEAKRIVCLDTPEGRVFLISGPLAGIMKNHPNAMPFPTARTLQESDNG